MIIIIVSEQSMFVPWVGTRYGDPSNVLGGLRLLIVGESHYPSDDKAAEWLGKTYPEQTRETVQADAIAAPYRFFKTLTRLVTGIPGDAWSSDQHAAFWHSVTFYDYVPVFIRKGKRPRVAEWRAGKEPFLQVLDDIKPEVAIICGLELWWYVMDALPGGTEANPTRRDVAQIGSARGLRIPHPTGSRGDSRYSYDTARPVLEQLIRDMKPNRPS